jgi:Family of unknown function (DUF6338)
MSEILKDFDVAKILIWIVPGAFISLFRSFSIRGSFPAVAKDDVTALVFGSVIYWFVFLLFGPGTSYSAFLSSPQFSGWQGFFALIAIPSAIGLCLGLIEAGDVIGKVFRRTGLRFPSPTPTAWETMFREMRPDSILMVTLKDGTTVIGRWIGGDRASASSTDSDKMDLYLGQIGEINAEGLYVPKAPQRGAYIVDSEIRFIEVVAVKR